MVHWVAWGRIHRIATEWWRCGGFAEKKWNLHFLSLQRQALLAFLQETYPESAGGDENVSRYLVCRSIPTRASLSADFRRHTAMLAVTALIPEHMPSQPGMPETRSC
eukprot:359252-Chlamydomonas_euryale.AAC.12